MGATPSVGLPADAVGTHTGSIALGSDARADADTDTVGIVSHRVCAGRSRC